MKWSNVRALAGRECRDLLRDRRTIVMIFLTPVMLYPVMGFGGYYLALQAMEQPVTIGIVNAEALPPAGPLSDGISPLPAVGWLQATPLPGSVLAAATHAKVVPALLAPSPLLVEDQFAPGLIASRHSRDLIRTRRLPEGSRAWETGEVDLAVVVPSGFAHDLVPGKVPSLLVYSRSGDERAHFADRRWNSIFNEWTERLKHQRFIRAGLPPDFDEPIRVERPNAENEPVAAIANEMASLVSRYLPFILVMWALAGALHPAIDLTAGEKERGTLETLLLSPALRSEIVAGKFLAVWAFSSVSALWNVSGLGFFIIAAHFALPGIEVLRISGLLFGTLFVVALAALFSALSIALGAYARSAKEGQYYLLPLFFVVMPLATLPLSPGVELNWFYSFVPITGLTLLLQKFLTVPFDQVPWQYVPAVSFSLLAWTALALAWAVYQFHREAILFREVEGFSWSGWLVYLGRGPKP